MTWPLTAGRSPRLFTGMQPCPVRLGGRPRRAERGELVVPERRDDAPARQIRLPVVRVLADRPGGRPPVFRLGDGPGLTNMRFGCPPALAAHDVILVGYRGVDGSVRLDAPDVAAALRAGGGDLLGPPSRGRVAQAAAVAARRLRDSGVDVAGYAPAPRPLHQLHRCDVELLLVSGELDVSTPPQHARDEALPYLPRGSQVIIPNASHVEDMWGLQPQATTQLVGGFLATGTVDARFDAAAAHRRQARRRRTARRGRRVGAHRHHVVETPPPLTALAPAFSRQVRCYREELNDMGRFEGAYAASFTRPE